MSPRQTPSIPFRSVSCVSLAPSSATSKLLIDRPPRRYLIWLSFHIRCRQPGPARLAVLQGDGLSICADVSHACIIIHVRMSSRRPSLHVSTTKIGQTYLRYLADLCTISAKRYQCSRHDREGLPKASTWTSILKVNLFAHHYQFGHLYSMPAMSNWLGLQTWSQAA